MNSSDKTTPQELPDNSVVDEIAVTNDAPETITSRAHSAQFVIDKLFKNRNIYAELNLDRFEKYGYTYLIFPCLFLASLLGAVSVFLTISMVKYGVTVWQIVASIAEYIGALAFFIATVIFSVKAIKESIQLRRQFKGTLSEFKAELDCEEEITSEELNAENFKTQIKDASHEAGRSVCVFNCDTGFREHYVEGFTSSSILAVIMILMTAGCTALCVLHCFSEIDKLWDAQWGILVVVLILSFVATIWVHIKCREAIFIQFNLLTSIRTANRAVKKIIAEEAKIREKVLSELK